MTDERVPGDEVGGGAANAAKTEANRSRRKLAILKRSGLFGHETQGAIIERACSLADLREAYGLVHEVYAETGYICPEPSRLRIHFRELTADGAMSLGSRRRVTGVRKLLQAACETRFAFHSTPTPR